MSAAQNGKGVVIDDSVQHASEHYLVKEAEQPFISFSEPEVVDTFIARMKADRRKLKMIGEQLQIVAKKKYNIEYMVKVYRKMFEEVSRR